ncbi:MAG: S1/P1 Nuclease, partial [Alistipes sp.]|nr:S1/P1 Nuclease [Alistipes sp.]
MKNKISIILLALIATMSVQKAMAWATWGHHVTAYIAEKHLTPEAKAKCEHYLQHSLPHFSSWQDYWRNSHPFKEITHWHMN